jgi:glycosyltransferase involved in cell wall biosynthesis
MLPALKALGITVHVLPNWGAWDVLAIAKLRCMLKKLKADACIAHGNRAVSLLRIAGASPLVAVTHNYKIKCAGLAAVFCPTQDLVRHTQSQGVALERITLIPNMVRAPATMPARQLHTPLVIGTMGRFVAKKGFDVFIEALALLKSQGAQFRAVLGGDGEEAAALKALAASKGLENVLIFSGWVGDKQAFFDSIDIFCLPSHHEPFGIVLLEALAGLPVVSTMSEGPSEIIQEGVSGLLTPKGDAAELANALGLLLADSQKAQTLARQAYNTVKTQYDLPVVGAKLDLALKALRPL